MLSLQVKRILRKVLRVKFENILTILMIMFNLYSICYHISLNGFVLDNIILELIIYGLITSMFYVSIKSFRQDMIKDLLK